MSQKLQILEHMKTGQPINKHEAYRLFGCMVLAQRIDDIEEDIRTGKIKGWQLCRKSLKNHHNATEYWLEPIKQPIKEHIPPSNEKGEFILEFTG